MIRNQLFSFYQDYWVNYPAPRVIITDKLRSYIKPTKLMCPETKHRTNKRLNNRVENAHQPTRRKEKILIKFKYPNSAQCTLSLMGKVRNIFAVNRTLSKLSF